MDEEHAVTITYFTIGEWRSEVKHNYDNNHNKVTSIIKFSLLFRKRINITKKLNANTTLRKFLK